MSMRLLTLGVLCLTTSLALAESRTWRDNTGKFSVEAELVEQTADAVVLRKPDGNTITVPLRRLSADDMRFLKSLDTPSNDGPAPDEQLNGRLAELVAQFDLPGMSAAIVTSDGLAAMGIAGVRKRDTDVAVTAADLWHLGSDTKAMTATLVAALVEQGVLTWETDLATVFPDQQKLHADFQPVTLLHLLSHRAGLPANLNLVQFLGDNGPALRLRAASEELAKPPQSDPGTAYEYSNLGYCIMGAIIEKLTDASWQENMREHVFQPLHMTTADFGGLGTPGETDQPWPHLADGSPVPQNGPAVDNPPVMGPAGRVHCTIQDWSRYIADLLAGMNGKPALLKTESYEKLTTPPFGGDYALGWITTQRDWAGGLALAHSGSNTMNYATAWIAPKRDVAFLICTNQGGDKAQLACDTAVGVLLEHHLAQAR